MSLAFLLYSSESTNAQFHMHLYPHELSCWSQQECLVQHGHNCLWICSCFSFYLVHMHKQKGVHINIKTFWNFWILKILLPLTLNCTVYMKMMLGKSLWFAVLMRRTEQRRSTCSSCSRITQTNAKKQRLQSCIDLLQPYKKWWITKLQRFALALQVTY